MQPHRPNPHPARAQRGFALLEVLIAVVVLAIGLLGMAALQSSALRNNQSSLERSQAVVQTYSMLDAMRANVIAARSNGYNMTLTSTPPTGTALIPSDQSTWINQLQATLNSSAQGAINCAGDICTITIQWDDSRGTAGNTAQQVVTVSKL